jgi:hypothetical protein
MAWSYLPHDIPSLQYDEFQDPSLLAETFYCPASPKYPFKHHVKIPERHKFVDYKHSLQPILNTDTVFPDFPISVIFYIGVIGRQRIYLDDVHTLLALYNHSDFLKMHMHNAWLLGKSEITVVLPEELFSDKNHLFVFCGSYSLLSLCPDEDISFFDFELFLFAASYLMIHDDFLLSMLQSLPIDCYDQNSTILRAYYMVNTMEVAFPLFSRWLLCKFPYVDTKFFTNCFDNTFHQFRKLMLNFQRHNRRYHQYFYQRWLGHGHCLKPCGICSHMDLEISSSVAQDIKNIMWDTVNNSKYYKSDTVVLPTVHTHTCGYSCVSTKTLQIETTNIFSVNTRDDLIWSYYSKLTHLSKCRFRLTHALHNELNRKCLEVLLLELSAIYTPFHIEFLVLHQLSITQKRMVIEKLLPLGIDQYLEYHMNDFDTPPVSKFFPYPFAREYDEFPNRYLPESIFG